MIDIQTIYAGITLAATGTIIYSLKAIPNKLIQRLKRNLIYSVTIYQYDELFDILELYMADNHALKYKNVEASLHSGNVFPSEQEVKKEVVYKQEETTFIFRYKGKKIVVSKGKEKLEKAATLKDIYFRKYSLSGFRAKKEIDLLLKEAILLYSDKEEKDIVRVHSNSQYGDWHGANAVRVKSLDKTIISPLIKQPLIKDIEEFLKSESWYLNTSIPYKRGICLYGPPGTGKTTLALAIASYTKRRVYCLNLNCLENDSRLPNAFKDMQQNSILLLEDIDKVFPGRENVCSDAKITFSGLLNCLDGAFYKHGIITIITTNHLEKLDEALLRTGRIDLKLEIPKPQSSEISEYLSIFYSKPLTIKGNYNLKMSDIQEICLQNKNTPEQSLNQIKLQEI